MSDDIVLPAWIESTARKTEMIFNAAAVPLAVTTLVLGAVNLNNCPVQPGIPKYLIMHAVVMLASVLVYLYVQRKKHQARANTYEEPTIVRVMNGIVIISGLIVLGFGIVWTFGAKPTFDDATKTTYCNFWVYYVAYASFVLFFVLLIVTICVTCGIACYEVCRKDMEQNQESKRETA
ncbi:hypothetical protein PRIPAC_82764 [Pristionchus pacificus]|uniref:Uncharacterized protein n=1 Tax=Pristionchus pacificus TaxID=54126 RepID=A0A2A6CJ29_PRIPA|nr:hypothetical protein PRIPAC_82764 [Pristionchus pacificus]|eukprot:PDM78224.1 hypothetical protein PRIPAC_30803 [Pristionchus pacificus]